MMPPPTAVMMLRRLIPKISNFLLKPFTAPDTAKAIVPI